MKQFTFGMLMIMIMTLSCTSVNLGRAPAQPKVEEQNEFYPRREFK